MSKELPSSLTINDAVALLLKISYIPGITDLLTMISYFIEEAESKLDNAIDLNEKDKYRALVSTHIMREGLARSLMGAIEAEITIINQGKNSLLEIQYNTFGSEKLVTSSVCAWGDHMGFGIEGWVPPRFWRKKEDRSHQTEYLHILDHIIETFCEEGGKHYEPGELLKNKVISAWVTEEYGELSDKVISTMCTIIRPLETSMKTKMALRRTV